MHHPSGRCEKPSGCSSDLSIIRPDDVDSCPDLPLCREASNCSSLHLSGHFSGPSGRPSVLEKLQDFFPRHNYGKIAAIVSTLVSMVRTRVHQIWKLRASDQPSGRPSAWSRRVKPLYGNYLQWTCDRPDEKATPSECGSQT
jgi:hypothetical protein